MKGKNDDETAGIEIVRKSLSAPINRILENAGSESALIVAKLLEQNKVTMTYDAQNHQVVDAFSKGIVDPTKVVRNALQSASSVASLLVTTEATICDAPNKKDESIAPSGGNMPMGGMGGMGGMGM
jgi:chaperonin GroEL